MFVHLTSPSSVGEEAVSFLYAGAERYILCFAAGLAQLVEQSLRKREVGSSSLLAGTTKETSPFMGRFLLDSPS